jgi:molybdopterin-guanine dinucleotide biosynthesis protein A
MGADKALLAVDDQPAFERVCRLLDAAEFDEVVLVGGEGKRFEKFGRAHVPDLEPGHGPLEGIRSALSRTAHEWIFVVAVDLLRLNDAAIRTMVEGRVDHPFDDVIHATSPDGPQPLLGWWRRSTLQTIERELSLGHRSVRNVLGMLRVSTIDLPADVLRNVNRPEDLG